MDFLGLGSFFPPGEGLVGHFWSKKFRWMQPGAIFNVATRSASILLIVRDQQITGSLPDQPMGGRCDCVFPVRDENLLQLLSEGWKMPEFQVFAGAAHSQTPEIREPFPTL
jgi:hypothetical protein